VSHLTGKVAVVTGGTRGIGLAIAAWMLEHGASVVISGRDADRLNVALKELARDGGPVAGLVADAARREDADRLVEMARERFGHLDVLVNNAGITRDRSLAKMTAEEWDAVIGTNLSSVFHMTSAVLPHMVQAGYGRIVNVSSIIGLHGNFGQANYAAAKAGIIGFTKSAALELVRKGITVNAVAPGFIETEMIAAMPDDARSRILERVPMGRFGRPEEIAQAVLFLVTRAEYMTGQVVEINGGLYT
jgi:acetoacetyl-CoA reductase